MKEVGVALNLGSFRGKDTRKTSSSFGWLKLSSAFGDGLKASKYEFPCLLAIKLKHGSWNLKKSCPFWSYVCD